ncbi:MAG: trigger factor [Tannerella sp.]|jgi:trigger factor|nr:trigger factor [Tannerella sp.]
MNISFKTNEDAVSGVITIEIVKEDYAERVKKSLQSVRQKANMPGFRKGMVPMGIVQKLYGKQAMVEEVNKLLGENLFSYIKDNGLKVMGEPIQSEKEQKPIDFETDENFEFCFDVALSPEINIKLTKKDKLPYYKVKIDDEMVEKQVESYLVNYGTYETGETAENEDLLKGTLAEIDEAGGPKEGGILIEDTILSPQYMKGKTEQKKFVGAKIGGKTVFNPYKAFKGNEAEIAALLRIDKEKVKEAKSDFSFEIKEIKRLKKAELNQEFYDKLYGEGAIKDEAAFRDRVRESLAYQYGRESDYRFGGDLRKFLLDKAGDVKFAEDVLKRFLLMTDKNKDAEALEKEFPDIMDGLKYQVIKDKLAEMFDLKTEKADIEDYARRAILMQMAQYGMGAPSEDMLQKYVDDMLQKPETVSRFTDGVIEEKLTPVIKEKITVEEKEVSVDDFYKKPEEKENKETIQ